jgi:hypothetical protein
MKKVCVLVLCVSLFLRAGAQQAGKYTEADYAKSPVWLAMIKDTSANYYEVEKAYRIYWQHHEKPEGEHDVIGEHAEREKIPSKRKQRKIEAENHMRINIRKYEMWHRNMLPYVQADGSILTPQQRLDIWKQQQNANK